jgi:anti-sigma factor RsiW
MKTELSCREIVAFLADYLSRDLLPEQAAAFDAHLAKCSACASYARTYLEAVAVSKAAFDCPDELANVPEELVQAILDVRRQEP